MSFSKGVLLSGALLVMLAACESSNSNSLGSSSSSSSSNTNEVALSGASGTAELAGNKVEIKNGMVFVNGVSYGAVAADAQVKYEMTSEGGVLSVGGQPRKAAP